jgi:hypothetical protein
MTKIELDLTDVIREKMKDFDVTITRRLTDDI